MSEEGQVTQKLRFMGSQPRRVIDKTPRQAKALLQVSRGGFDAKGLRGVMAPVEHVDP